MGYKSKITLLCALGATTAAQCAKPVKPNIIIILADDMGWGDVGFNGGEIQTPSIDELANKAAILDRFYTAPVSSPTRAGLLTGRYPNRFGIREVVIPPWREDGLDANEQTIADMLGRNGYENRAIIGKWHLGHTHAEHYPMSRGFTHFYGHLNGAIDYFDHTREGELDWHNDWESCYDEGYSTELITREALRCIDEYQKDGPFFIYIPYNAPHSPFQAQESDIAIYTDDFDSLSKREKQEVTYKAMVTCMDRGIGQIIDKLEADGLMENTFLLFFSDNGAVPNQSLSTSSGDYRGKKFTEWDGGVRSPTLLHWPAASESYKNIESQLSGFVDVMPTLKELVGDKSKPKNEFDGVSLMPILSGKKSSIKRDFYLGCGAVVSEGYKLIRPDFNSRMKLKQNYLVDYANDPYEANDASQGNEKEVARLLKVAIKYDTITPSIPERPYDEGKKGFVAPKEWRVTKQ
ncbi:MAG: sulfatase-like hydrolase/transferase [Rikenellaceae bacterium]